MLGSKIVVMAKQTNIGHAKGAHMITEWQLKEVHSITYKQDHPEVANQGFSMLLVPSA